MTQHQDYPTPEPQPAEITDLRRQLRIGFPASSDDGQTFPLTPEAAQLLGERGYSVVIEKNAGNVIHYNDEAYTRRGITVDNRRSTLGCDIVVSLDGLQPDEIDTMKRGALLLTLTPARNITSATVEALTRRYIHTIDLNDVEDNNGHRPFGDIMTEIAGRAAMTVAAFMLAHPDHGKGIMLGGVTGVIACEVVIIGSDSGARAAAESAIAMGTIVRMLDNDPYGLREAEQTLGRGIATSSLQPHVVENLLRSADIVIASGIEPCDAIGGDVVATMKKGVIVMDLSDEGNSAFPSLPTTTVTNAMRAKPGTTWGGRVCYTSPGRTVPRTAAMALSNTLLQLMRNLSPADGDLNPMKMSPGIRQATCTLRGKVVNPAYACSVGQRPFDINLLLSCS